MEVTLEPLPPIFTAHLFPKLEAKLIELLRSLSPQDWEKPTLAPKWKVKDVAAHLLDTETRRIAFACRETPSEPLKPLSNAEVLTLVNNMNAQGVFRYGQLSTDELIREIEAVAPRLAEYLQSLDPFSKAPIGVSWAGQEESANWFDIAREFTERWHHQQQIRLAVEKPGIMTPELYHPVLDCFLRALPYTYRSVSAQSGALAQFDVSGECGGSWFLYKNGADWTLNASPIGDQISRTIIPQEIAWRIFTKGMSRYEAKAQVQVSGDKEIGLHILGMLSIVG